jgi:hypothetical protein
VQSRTREIAMVMAAVALIVASVGCSSNASRSSDASTTPPEASPPASAEPKPSARPREPADAQQPGPLRAPQTLVRVLRQNGIDEASIDTEFGPADYRLWEPRRRQERFGGGIVFERRLPPCGRGGLWAHWDADAHLRDFRSDLKLRPDGDVLTTHLAVYPDAAVAKRWMHQFTHESFNCNFIRTPAGDRPVQRSDTFALGRYRAAPNSIEVDDVAGMGEEYRLFSGERHSVASVAFQANNAVLLVSHWRLNARTSLEPDAYTTVERLSRPVLVQLQHHYG